MGMENRREQMRGWWFFPWRVRRDFDLKRLSLREFFAGYGTISEKQKNVYDVPKRMSVLMCLACIFVLFFWTMAILIFEHSALSHQCEELYSLWYMAASNAAGYGSIFCCYVWIINPHWFRGAVVVVTVFLALMVAWWLFIWNQMAKSCELFYHIKYPQLQHTVHICGLVNTLMLGMLIVEQCYVMCSTTDEDDLWEEDPIMGTTIFWRRDEKWVPPLFEAPEVRCYKEGVNQWSTAAQERVAHLQNTLDKAEKIRKGSENQSMLLRQVTNLVVETETKVTKTSALMDDQEKLIGEFRGSFDEVKNQLHNMNSHAEAGFDMCTSMDCCLWITIVLMVVVVVGCMNYGFSKWAAMFGFAPPGESF